VRSPGEYRQAHIPGAINLPLFSDQERAEVGTCYKQQGLQPALLLGLERVGPKLHTLVTSVQDHLSSGRVRVYCWRGGMRSQSVAHLLRLAGFEPAPLGGGYKQFRRWVLNRLEQPLNLRVIGGFTGSGKSNILRELANLGEATLDLERLARHRGSAFGAVGLEEAQPSQESFENQIAWALSGLQGRPIWVEDESRLIGMCRVPTRLYEQMGHAPLFQIHRSREERKRLLLEEYQHATLSELIAGTEKIRRRLGGQRTQEVISRLEAKDSTAIELLLDYYDRAYAYSLEKRGGPCSNLSLSGADSIEWAKALAEMAKESDGRARLSNFRTRD
jgi:tRNA 2-selenouridine synthase